jgi:hypothetical protein
MIEKELGKALLRGEEPIDLGSLTQKVLKRDRRRIWILGIVSVIAWMMVVMLPWATILPMLAKVIEHQADAGNATTLAASDQNAQSLRLAQIVKQGTMATFFGSIASMFVAAVCTVLLIILSRRATMRQVNLRLAEISAQLANLAGKSK